MKVSVVVRFILLGLTAVGLFVMMVAGQSINPDLTRAGSLLSLLFLGLSFALEVYPSLPRWLRPVRHLVFLFTMWALALSWSSGSPTDVLVRGSVLVFSLLTAVIDLWDDFSRLSVAHS